MHSAENRRLRLKPSNFQKLSAPHILFCLQALTDEKCVVRSINITILIQFLLSIIVLVMPQRSFTRCVQ